MGILVALIFVAFIVFGLALVVIPGIRAGRPPAANLDVLLLLFSAALLMPLLTTYLGYVVFSRLRAQPHGWLHEKWVLPYAFLVCFSGLPFGIAFLRRVRKDSTAALLGTGMAFYGAGFWFVSVLVISMLFVRSCC